MRSILAGLLVALLGVAPLAGAAKSNIDAKIRAQREKQHQVQAQLQQKRGQLEAARSRFLTARQQLDETNRNIAIAQRSLGALQTSLSWNRKRLDWNELQLQAARATLKRHGDALARRLVDAYEKGQLGYLAVILSATSFTDFVERWEDIRLLVAANQRALRERKAAEAKVDSVERDLMGNRARLQASEVEVRQKQMQLVALAGQRLQLTAAADAEKRQVAQEVTELEETSAQAEAQIQELIREKQREERAAVEARRRAALLAGEEPPPEAGAPSYLSWPVSGRISSPFGMRTNPGNGRFLMHTGIDIAAEMGTTIVAPADGHVISAGWNDGGYGNMIIISHGGSMSTLYGHLSQIFVGVDQEVKRGQALGAVGSTGHSTGPHLHFEVRLDGRPVDPMSYLR
ncbi:MAG: peptidoglycan DD-metalloendopeptidase family protein [Candidatus Eremiobacteraeota bacterium]|nr:peptidoglycan DD-metalloendopeptidase family protein [Candidatus Eremiobacteraeota bacterium]